MGKYLIHFAILASIFLVVGCSSSNPTASGENSKANNEKTVKTFVENELTTTNELKEALNKSDSVDRLTALNQYLKERYGNLMPKGDFERFVNTNEGLIVLLPANSAGYELKPTHIKIQSENGKLNAYTFKADVDYSKDGKTSTSTFPNALPQPQKVSTR